MIQPFKYCYLNKIYSSVTATLPDFAIISFAIPSGAGE
jgi:hypothetical protein